MGDRPGGERVAERGGLLWLQLALDEPAVGALRVLLERRGAEQLLGVHQLQHRVLAKPPGPQAVLRDPGGDSRDPLRHGGVGLLARDRAGRQRSRQLLGGGASAASKTESARPAPAGLLEQRLVALLDPLGQGGGEQLADVVDERASARQRRPRRRRSATKARAAAWGARAASRTGSGPRPRPCGGEAAPGPRGPRRRAAARRCRGGESRRPAARRRRCGRPASRGRCRG